MNYRLENIDPELWKDFKAFAALEKTTIRDKLLGFITREVQVFRTERGHQGNVDDLIKKAGKRI